ncbi:Glycerophosphodiester phosphodiesterase [Thalassocella blandensis]|nr:Glycerophosphodiester phosphodiesterase [Thalassocella blandensis]
MLKQSDTKLRVIFDEVATVIKAGQGNTRIFFFVASELPSGFIFAQDTCYMKVEYTVVGHRGFPHRFPENTLLGLVEAARAGAAAVELDVQISSDGVPVVFHDATLERVTAATGNVWDYTAEQLTKISAHEPQRFGETFNPTYIASLEDVCLALKQYPCSVFIELKQESLEFYGREAMLANVLKASTCLGDRRKIISFDAQVLSMVKRSSHLPIGWVLDAYNDEVKQQALTLNPEILAYDVAKLTRDQFLWLGNWSWFLYDITDRQEAEYWHGRGVQYIESWNFVDVQRLKAG